MAGEMRRHSARVPACLIALSAVVGAVAAPAASAHLRGHSLASSPRSRMGWARQLRGSQQLEKPAHLLLGQHAYQLLAPLRGGAVGTIKKEQNGGEEGVRCRLKKGGVEMEVLCHAAKIEMFREGSALQGDVLITPDIFKDIKKGDRMAAADIEKAFGHTDVAKAAEEILLKGEFHLSTAERKEKTQDKLAQILSFIASNYMDPKTNTPIPRTRVENGIETMKGLKIDPFRSAATQAEEITKRLKDMFALVKNEVHGTVTVSLQLAGTVTGILHGRGGCKVLKDAYTDEEYQAHISWMANDYERLVGDLTKATGGQYQLVQDMANESPAGADVTCSVKEGKGHDSRAKKKAHQDRGKERDEKRSASAGVDLD